MMIQTFSDLNLPQFLLKAVEKMGFVTPTPVQAGAILPLLEGRDVLAQAATGSGKTAAFGLPFLAQIDVELEAPQLLVMSPTRELAIQIEQAFLDFSQFTRGIKTALLCGGQPYSPQIRSLRGGAQVVVGTPGRMLDHIEKGTLKLEQTKFFVLDEADEMLKMGFIDDVQTVLEHLGEDHQTALFSATMPAPIKRITHQYLKDPVEISIAKTTASEPNIEQFVCYVHNQAQKNEALTRFLEVEDFDGVMIFTATKIASEQVAELLLKSGLKAAALNGDMAQNVREKTLEKMRNASLDILVATDVAARGIDIDRISLVINYDITDNENYIHRIGRTGRAGRSGRAILFVTRGKERYKLRTIERLIKKQIPEIMMPSSDELMAKRRLTFKQKMDQQLEHHSLDQYRSLLDELFDEHVDRNELAAALLMLLQRDKKLILPPDPKPHKHGEPSEHKGKKRESAARYFSSYTEPMNRYRIELGRDDGVEVKHIVGAIANEGNIASQFIGHIHLGNDHATVELPAGLPKQVISHFMYRARILSKPMQMSLIGKVDADHLEPRERKKSGQNFAKKRKNSLKTDRLDLRKEKKVFKEKRFKGR